MKRKATTLAMILLVWMNIRQGLSLQDQNSKAAVKARKAELKTGAALYDKYACKSCHGAEGIAQGNLPQAYKKFNDEQLKAYIKAPSQFGNSKMPAFSALIPETDFKPLMAYIKWLGQEADKQKKK